MSFRIFFKRVVLLAFCLSGLSVFGQQVFTVEAVSGNTFTSLDDNTLVTYTVRLTGASANNVVPSLSPPACSFNSSGNSYFSTSYAGADGSATPGPISTWPVNTTRTVSFYVHLYDETGVCTSGLGDVCTESQTEFDLSFTFTESDDPVSAPNDTDLRMNLPTSGNRLDLSEPVYSSETCVNFEQAGQPWEEDFTPGPLNYDSNDPNQRVILRMDWYAFRFANTDPAGLFALFAQFNVFVNPGGNFINVITHTFTGEMQQVTLPTFDHLGNPVNQAPYGGGGDIFVCSSPTVDTNLWDITDLPTNDTTAFPVRDFIAADTNGMDEPNAFHQQILGGSFPVTLRSMTLYTANQTVCAAGAEVFGPRPSNFEFTEYHIAADGTTQATLDVPSAWGTSTQLGTNYNMEWYLRSNTDFESIPAANSKLLTLNFNLFDLVPAGSDPADYQIEGRVKYDPDGGSDSNASFVSAFSPFHTLGYNLGGATYDNQEDGADADNFLDPGETAAYSYSLNNPSTLGIDDLNLVISNPNPNNLITYNGTLLDGPLTQPFGAMSPGQTLPVSMNLTLLQVDPTTICDNLELEVTTSFTHDGVAHSFADTLLIPVNCTPTALESRLGSSADNYLQLDPPQPITQCDQDIVVVSNNSAFTYQFRFYQSLSALVEDTPAEINGSGVWAEPVLPTDPDNLPLTYYVRLQANNNNETRRITSVSIQVADDGNCDPCGPFDINGDEVVNQTDFALNAARNWEEGNMTTLVAFINDSQPAGCFIP